MTGSWPSELDQKMGDESIRYIAKKAGLSPQTVLNILNGTTWPDLRPNSVGVSTTTPVTRTPGK